LIEYTRAEAVRMAQAVYDQALQPDGKVYYEPPDVPHGRDLHWWVHAEAMVGFYNAYQLSGKEYFAEAASRVWTCIERYFSDRKNGDWFKVLNPDGKPRPNSRKVGPWECPYHQGRACIEMIHRLP
jgi:mannobiose 2-epimerase